MKKIVLGGLLFLSGIACSLETTAQQNSDVASQGTRIINLFPNPAMNSATVVLNYFPVQMVYVDVVDFNGEVRRSFSFTPGGRQLTFDVGFLERGYYVVRVRESSRLVDMTKLVKS